MNESPRPGIDYLPDNFVEPARRPRPLGLQVSAFALLFVALQGLWSMAQGTVLEHVAVGDWTVAPAARWIQWLTPGVGAEAVGYSIKAPGGGINVLNGCEGFEVIFLWLAALVVAALTWRRRLAGLLLGLPLIWVLNQLRILTLFYTYRSDKGLFALLHGTVAPLVLVVLVVIAFVILISGSAPGPARHDAD